MNQADKYFLDEEGYYVTKEIFRRKLDFIKCMNCGKYCDFVFAEKWRYFEYMCCFMLMDIEIYGLECNACKRCYIYKDE